MSASHPLVSIVTPTYNHAAYLESTIKSVINQNYKNIQYIVINDGSTDATEKILEKYSTKFQCINQSNIGQVKTLAKGWALSEGEYIGYLSSDDILLPDAIGKMVSLLNANDDVVCVYPDADLIDKNNTLIKKNVCRSFDLSDYIVHQQCYIGPGALFRRRKYEEIGGWNQNFRLAPDAEFWIRLCRTGKILFHAETLAAYRFHSNQGIYKYISEEYSGEYIRILDEYFSQAPEKIPSSLVSRKNESYANAYVLIACNYFRGFQILKGVMFYRKACYLYPSLNNPKTLIRLLRNIVSKPIRNIITTMHSCVKRR